MLVFISIRNCVRWWRHAIWGLSSLNLEKYYKRNSLLKIRKKINCWFKTNYDIVENTLVYTLKGNKKMMGKLLQVFVLFKSKLENTRCRSGTFVNSWFVNGGVTIFCIYRVSRTFFLLIWFCGSFRRVVASSVLQIH